MSASKSTLLADRKVAIHTAAAALASPSGAPAAALSIESWRSGRAGPRLIALKLWGSDGSVDIAGPVDVNGWHPGDSRWYSVGVLDGGGNINVADTRGRHYKLYDMPAWATAVQLSSGAITGGTISAEVEALDVDGAV